MFFAGGCCHRYRRHLPFQFTVESIRLFAGGVDTVNFQVN